MSIVTDKATVANTFHISRNGANVASTHDSSYFFVGRHPCCDPSYQRWDFQTAWHEFHDDKAAEASTHRHTPIATSFLPCPVQTPTQAITYTEAFIKVAS